MLGGFSLFVNTSIVVKIAALVVVSLVFYFLRDYLKKTARSILPYLLLVAFALSLILSQLFSMLFYPEFSDESVEIDGQIIEVNEYTASYGLVIETEKIDGDKDTHKIYVYASMVDIGHVRLYDIVELRGRICELGAEEKLDTDVYYASRGISGKVEDVIDFTVTARGTPRIEYYLNALRDLCSRRIESVTTEDTASFLRALVLGDKSDLDGNTKLNFKRLGISHILALSGMHLAIVGMGVLKLLTLLGVNKNARLITVSAVLIFYMSLTGFSATICRATIMTLITYILFLLRYKSDIFTSLMISVSIIVLLEPYAIFDLSLQLSFLSILGIIACQSIIAPYRPKTRIRRLLFSIPEAILISIFANIAILPIGISKFGAVSILTPISTLMFSLVCTLLIYAGILIILLGNFLFLGDIANFVTKSLKWAIELLSDTKAAYSRTDFEIIAAITAIIAVLFVGYLLATFKHRRIYAGILSSLYIIVISLTTILNAAVIHKDALELNTELSDAILIKDDGRSALIYNGGNSNNAAYSASDYLNTKCISYLDCLILQNYNTLLPEFVEIISSNVKIDRILLLEPENNYEKNIATEIAVILQYFGTDMRFYSTDSEIQLGEYTFASVYHTPYESGELSENVYTITDSTGYVYTYVSDGTRLENHSQAMRATDCLIIGNYGKSYSAGYTLKIKCENIQRIIIGTSLRLDEATEAYYEKTGASVEYTEAPKNLLN